MKETSESADIAGICDVCRLSCCHPLLMQRPACSARPDPESSRTVDPEREVKRSDQKAQSMKETIESADTTGICDVCRLSACHPLKMQYPAWSARSSLEIFRTFECEVEIILHTDNESLHKHASATLTTGNVVFIAVHQTDVPLCL